jgi:hypothetical protein
MLRVDDADLKVLSGHFLLCKVGSLMFVVDTVNYCYYGFGLYATDLTNPLISYLVVTAVLRMLVKMILNTEGCELYVCCWTV